MKQQNDYTLLMNEYNKQNIAIHKLEGELKEKVGNKKGNNAK